MDNIYFKAILTNKVIVKSKFLDENIDEYIENHLKNKVEGICIDEGFVKKDSIKILKKSIGMLLGSKFTGDITYEVVYSADLCNPVIGNILECKVKFINKLGILGNNDALTIIIGKQFHMNDEELNTIKENDIVKVEVIAKKFSLKDKEIRVVGRLWSEKINLKKNKKDIISSDLTPIVADEFVDNEIDQDFFDNNSDENEEFSVEDEEEEEMDDDFIQSDDEENIKVENPDENNLDAEDIEIDDLDDYEENSETEYD